MEQWGKGFLKKMYSSWDLRQQVFIQEPEKERHKSPYGYRVRGGRTCNGLERSPLKLQEWGQGMRWGQVAWDEADMAHGLAKSRFKKKKKTPRYQKEENSKFQIHSSWLQFWPYPSLAVWPGTCYQFLSDLTCEKGIGTRPHRTGLIIKFPCFLNSKHVLL